MKELVLNELTWKQKIGMTMTAFVSDKMDNIDPIIELIKKHSLGAVWINPTALNFDEKMKRIKDAADYPILIMCDCENGINEITVGYHNAIGCTGSEELAYSFGKVIGVKARALGYNVVCNPVIDMIDCAGVCGMNIRSYDSDKRETARLASAEARGMRDGGILAVAKHYSGIPDEPQIDTHMAEGTCSMTKEEFIDYTLYPYIELMKEDLIEGIMVGHNVYTNFDPDNPATLSSGAISILRELGFNGFYITDALCMMGIVAKYGPKVPFGLCIGKGLDLSLPFTTDNKFAFEAMCECYENGIIADARLDEAASRILAAQHKTLREPAVTELTEDDYAKFERINSDSIYMVTDEGISESISKDGCHLFVILTETEMDQDTLEREDVDTFSRTFIRPNEITEKINAVFKNSDVRTLYQFPNVHETGRLLKAACDYEDVVFITSFIIRPNIGIEELTPRIRSIMMALQVTNKISTIMHFGNPYVLENVPHIPRKLFGAASCKSPLYAIDVLAGDYPALGVPTYDVTLK